MLIRASVGICAMPLARSLHHAPGKKPMGWAVQSLVRRLTAWFGGFEPLVLLALAMAVAGTWAFLAIADEVIEGETRAVDRQVVQWMRRADDPSQAIGPPWLQTVGRDVTALGGYGVVALLTIAVIGFLLLSARRSTAVFVAVAVSGGYLVSNLLKLRIARPRPALVPAVSDLYTSSFPSTHATVSAVTYLALAAITAAVIKQRRLKVYILVVGLTLTLLVGASRVYLGVHYPTDVLAGWTVGLVWALLCWLAARLLQRRGQIEPVTQPPETAQRRGGSADRSASAARR